jgi:hypothetical protein
MSEDPWNDAQFSSAERLARLRAHLVKSLEGLRHDFGPACVSITFVVSSEESAQELKLWFAKCAGHPAALEVHHRAVTHDLDFYQNQDVSSSIGQRDALQHWAWRLEVKGPARKPLTERDLEIWFGVLDSLPRPDTWRLIGVAIEELRDAGGS